MKWGFVEKIGSVGAFLAALACPACFPMLATVGAALGLGVLLPFEGIVFSAFRILVLIALVGNLLAYWKHKSLIPLLVGVASPVAVLFTISIHWNASVLYAGLFGLLLASVLNALANRRCRSCPSGAAGQ